MLISYKSILNAELLKQAMQRTRFATMPQIGMNGMPQVRVGIRRSCYVINRQSHAFSCNSRIIVYVTVKLHSASPRAIT